MQRFYELGIKRDVGEKSFSNISSSRGRTGRGR